MDCLSIWLNYSKEVQIGLLNELDDQLYNTERSIWESKTLKAYVNENGDIETDDLLNTSPFDDQDILELFGEKVKVLSFIVNTMHNVVQAA